MRPNDVHPRKFSPETVRRFRQRLERWYRRHHRTLPWRAAPGEPRTDAYRVLVSEAMLQQTQVATVIDYYRRFLDAFPTVATLAAADEQQVLRLWQGLGYYRRARNLHAAAKAIVEQHASVLPADVAALRALPGVGEYTAGAVASIAFDLRTPVVDGNVARVLARVFAVDQPVDAPATKKQLWQLAEALVPEPESQRKGARRPYGPADHNQAVMELGALVCLPRNPQCLVCPLASICQAHQAGRTHELPRKLDRKKPQAVEHHVLLCERRGKWLVEQRPDRGLWSKMWQFVTFEAPGTPASAATDALAAQLQQHTGLTCDALEEQERFIHQTTHRTIQFVVHRVAGVAGRTKPGLRWATLAEVEKLAMSNPQRRLARGLGKKL